MSSTILHSRASGNISFLSNGYTGHSEYTRQDPPTYVVIGANDGIASPPLMRRRVEALKAAGIEAEFHLFPNLRHGFGLGIGTSAEGWVDGAVKFWEKHIDNKNTDK